LDEILNLEDPFTKENKPNSFKNKKISG